MTLVGSAIFILALATHAGPEAEWHQKRIGDTLEFFGYTAAEMIEKNGSAAFLDYANKLVKTTGIKASMYDARLNSIPAGRTAPETRELAALTMKTDRPESLQAGGKMWFAEPITTTSGAKYAVIGELPPLPSGPFGIIFFDARMTMMRLLESFIVSGIVCFLVVWYLTAPVRKLRLAAQKFGSGDLSVRVGPDFSKRKDELADLAGDFDVMAEHIESLMDGQRRLLRDISHELRSPLARLNVALELARRHSGPSSEKHLGRIGQEAERMNELIGQLLTLTLLESGAEKLKKTRVDMSELVCKIAEDADFEADSLNRSVVCNASRGIIVEGSEELLSRAIENVIRNAVRYTSDGSKVEVFLKYGGTDGAATAIVRVRDHGPGLPEEELKNIFKPFYRASDARERQTGGTGLGLAITDRAIRLHGGTIDVSNAPDGGLIVEIMIPVSVRKNMAVA